MVLASLGNVCNLITLLWARHHLPWETNTIQALILCSFVPGLPFLLMMIIWFFMNLRPQSEHQKRCEAVQERWATSRASWLQAASDPAVTAAPTAEPGVGDGVGGTATESAGYEDFPDTPQGREAREIHEFMEQSGIPPGDREHYQHIVLTYLRQLQARTSEEDLPTLPRRLELGALGPREVFRRSCGGRRGAPTAAAAAGAGPTEPLLHDVQDEVAEGLGSHGSGGAADGPPLFDHGHGTHGEPAQTWSEYFSGCCGRAAEWARRCCGRGSTTPPPDTSVAV